MLDLRQITPESAQALSGVLFDLDDTLLTHGQLTEDAYRALFRLKESGLLLILVTGRPASWADLLCRIWPLDAAIAENGAMTFQKNGARLELVDSVSVDVRRQRQTRLMTLVDSARSAFPELVPADDVEGRVSDYTFDIGEHHQAREELIVQARDYAHAHGARTSRSSVHLHYSFDPTDKASGTLHYLTRRGLDSTSARGRFAYVGDSQNDASCFAAFELSVGVKNLRGLFSLLPRFQTSLAGGAGFAQLADRLCELRRR